MLLDMKKRAVHSNGSPMIKSFDGLVDLAQVYQDSELRKVRYEKEAAYF